jgi:hypothetical protein
MGLEEAEHRQRDRARPNERVDGRKPAREAGGLDAAARLVFAKSEPPNAVMEERREPLFDMEPTCVYFSWVLDEFCRHPPMRADE